MVGWASPCAFARQLGQSPRDGWWHHGGVSPWGDLGSQMMMYRSVPKGGAVFFWNPRILKITGMERNVSDFLEI